MWKLFFTEDHSDKSQGATLFLWRRRGRRKKTLRILEWAWNANGKRISKVLQLGYPLISSTYWLLFSKRPFVAILSQSSKWMKGPFREGNYAVFCKLSMAGSRSIPGNPSHNPCKVPYLGVHAQTRTTPILGCIGLMVLCTLWLHLPACSPVPFSV